MNIAIFSDTYLPEVNGVAYYTERLRQELEKRGHSVFLFVPNGDLSYRKDPTGKIWYIPSVRFYGDKRSRFVIPFFRPKELRDIRFDIVHTQTPAMLGALGALTARRRKLPLIHTYHTLFEEYAHYLHLPQRITKPLIRKILKVFLGLHGTITVPSGVVKELLEAQSVKKPLVLLPSGIERARLEEIAARGDAMAALARLGLSPDANFIITTSRLDKEKNIEFLFEALAKAKEKMPDIRLLIVGKGTAREYLEKQAERKGVSENVVFTGFLSYEDMFALYGRARAFVFASTTETQGYVILEALALGLPAIAIDAMGTHDMIPEDRGGFLIPFGDVAAFAQKIVALSTDDDLHSQKKAEAVLQADTLSLDSMIGKILSIYADML
jgi:1,2-diacylglycerol 3-alpha-glucosyltransferase